MNEHILSVGIDIGTTTTQLVLSRLTLENRATPFSVPRVTIAAREVVYRSDIHFTPLLSDTVIDAAAVREIVAEEYRKSGFRKEEIGTGAVIITGETARKENAREVLASLAGFAGDFVAVTAGPDLESILAARGAGAEEYSRAHHTEIVHLDIGGGTSNLAHYVGGTLAGTACLNIGGRLVKLAADGVVRYVSPALREWIQTDLPQVGQRTTRERLAPVVAAMAEGLARAIPAGVQHLSFSGGVADCMWGGPEDWTAYGDLGPLLGHAVRRKLEGLGYTLRPGAETIRATVVGAGSHATEISGSTIFYRRVQFPLKNLPILKLTEDEERGSPGELAEAIRAKLGWFSDEGGLTHVALALRGAQNPAYRRVGELAEGIGQGLAPLIAGGYAPVVVVERDMAKALGQALAALTDGPLLCLDGVAVETGDYIDVGAPVAGGKVLPVIIKTLVFQSGADGQSGAPGKQG